MTEVAVAALGEERKGHVVWISGENDKVFLWSKVSCPTAESTCCWVKHILGIDQGGRREAVQVCLGCSVDANPGLLNVAMLSCMLSLSGTHTRDPKQCFIKSETGVSLSF